MFVQCNIDNNDFLLLDDFVDIKHIDDFLNLRSTNGKTCQLNSTKVGYLFQMKRWVHYRGKAFQPQGIILSTGCWVCNSDRHFAWASIQLVCGFHPQTKKHQILKKDTQVWIPLPKLLDNVLAINRYTKNIFWENATAEEIKMYMLSSMLWEHMMNVPTSVAYTGFVIHETMYWPDANNPKFTWHDVKRDHKCINYNFM